MNKTSILPGMANIGVYPSPCLSWGFNPPGKNQMDELQKQVIQEHDTLQKLFSNLESWVTECLPPNHDRFRALAKIDTVRSFILAVLMAKRSKEK